ncbi:hypothetical protein SOVF_119240 [Spinacia oleracea]|nr:hypothetical protein SOVF_119240 [Spinacia oleracea]
MSFYAACVDSWSVGRCRTGKCCKEKVYTTKEDQNHRIRNQQVCLTGQSNIQSDILLVDAAWGKSTRRNGRAAAAIGWLLVRDHGTTHEEGECVYSHSKLQTEALAVLKGLVYARQNQVDNIVIKMGSTKLFQALKTFPNNPLEVASVCYDIINIAKSFNNCSINRCPRETVNTARILAVKARRGQRGVM